MRVLPQGKCDCRVPEKFLDKFWTRSCCQVVTGATMPKVMEWDFRQAESFQLPLEILEEISCREGRSFRCGK